MADWRDEARALAIAAIIVAVIVAAVLGLSARQGERIERIHREACTAPADELCDAYDGVRDRAACFDVVRETRAARGCEVTP